MILNVGCGGRPHDKAFYFGDLRIDVSIVPSVMILMDAHFLGLKDSIFEKVVCFEVLACSRARDVILDLKAVNKAIDILTNSKNVDRVCFSYRQYSLAGTVFQRLRDECFNLLAVIVRKFGIHPRRSGIYRAKKETVDIQDYPSEYDVLQQKHNTVQIETETLHLRPRYCKEDQIKRGKARAHLQQYSLFKTVLASLVFLQPYLLMGYLTEKRR